MKIEFKDDKVHFIPEKDYDLVQLGIFCYKIENWSINYTNISEKKQVIKDLTISKNDLLKFIFKL